MGLLDTVLDGYNARNRPMPDATFIITDNWEAGWALRQVGSPAPTAARSTPRSLYVTIDGREWLMTRFRVSGVHMVCLTSDTDTQMLSCSMDDRATGARPCTDADFGCVQLDCQDA